MLQLLPITDKISNFSKIDTEEKEIFKALVERNAKNMNFKHYKILFTNEQNLEKTVKTEHQQKWSGNSDIQRTNDEYRG